MKDETRQHGGRIRHRHPQLNGGIQESGGRIEEGGWRMGDYDSVRASRDVSLGRVASALTARMVGRPPEVVTVRSR